MVLPKNMENYNEISKLDYNSFQFKIAELETKNTNEDELKSLQMWNSKLKKQITPTRIESIESEMKNYETRIFFRKSHFACIYKYLDNVYSLITCKGNGLNSCCWHSLPNENGEFVYYDENFNLTLRKPWTQKNTQNSSNNQNTEKKNTNSTEESENNICNIS